MKTQKTKSARLDFFQKYEIKKTEMKRLKGGKWELDGKNWVWTHE